METIAVALLGAFAGGLLTYLTTTRKIYDTSVVRERKEWRDAIRFRTLKLGDALKRGDEDEKERLLREFRIRLNPNDAQDIDLLGSSSVEELTGRVAILLKHDWERAKIESSLIKGFFFRAVRPSYSPDTAKVRYGFKEFRTARWLIVVSVAIVVFAPFVWPNYLQPAISKWQNFWSDALAFACS